MNSTYNLLLYTNLKKFLLVHMQVGQLIYELCNSYLRHNHDLSKNYLANVFFGLKFIFFIIYKTLLLLTYYFQCTIDFNRFIS